jgi:hypothetical protein
LADAKLAWQQGEIAAEKTSSIAAAVAQASYSTMVAHAKKAEAVELAWAQGELEQARAAVQIGYRDTLTTAGNARESDLAEADLAYWSASDIQTVAASETLDAGLEVAWSAYLVDQAAASRDWWASTAADYSQYIEGTNSLQDTYQTTVSGKYSTLLSQVAAASMNEFSAKAAAIEARDLGQAGAERDYVLALSGTPGEDGPAETYALAIAQAERDYTVAVALANYQHVIDDDHEAYYAALTSASNARQQALRNAKVAYAAAEAVAVAGRTVSLATIDGQETMALVAANLGDVATRAAVKRAYLTTESNANRQATIDRAGLDRGFSVPAASSYASAMAGLASASGTPWAAFDAAEAAAHADEVSSDAYSSEAYHVTEATSQRDRELAAIDADALETSADAAVAALQTIGLVAADGAAALARAVAIVGIGASGTYLKGFPDVPQPEEARRRAPCRRLPGRR